MQPVQLLAEAARQWTAMRVFSQPLQVLSSVARQWTAARLSSQTLTLQAVTQSAGTFLKSASQSLNMLATAIRQLSATRSLSQPLQLIAETARQWTSVSKLSQVISITTDIIRSFTKYIPPPPPPPFFPPMVNSYIRSVTQRLSMHGTAMWIQAIFKTVGETVISTVKVLTEFTARASVVQELLMKSTRSFTHTPRIILPPVRMGNARIPMIGLLLGVILTILYIYHNRRENASYNPYYHLS